MLERFVLGAFVATKGQPSGPPSVTPEPVQQVPAKTSISVPSVSLWRVQLGAFNGKEQAEQLAEQTRKKGFPAIVSGTNPHRVLAGVTRTKEAAQNLSQELTKAGYKPYVAEFQYVGGTFTITVADAEYAALFKNGLLTLADAVPMAAEVWDYYYTNRKSDLTTAAAGLATTLSNVRSKMSQATVPADMQTAHAALTIMLEKAAANAEDIKTLAEKGGKDLYVKAGTTYLEILDTLESFLAQLPK
jgi:hypothetical protein